jgi:hypothetical protein
VAAHPAIRDAPSAFNGLCPASLGDARRQSPVDANVSGSAASHLAAAHGSLVLCATAGRRMGRQIIIVELEASCVRDPPRLDRPRLSLKALGSDVRRGSEDRGVRLEIDDSAQSMLWPQAHDRRLKAPERQLLEAIAAGELDEHLVAIADAVHARRQLLHTVRSARAIADLCVGDRVTFTNQIRPRYLEHELAEVIEVDDRTVTVRLWRPVGRFGDRELRCPPLALRKLDHGTSIRYS